MTPLKTALGAMLGAFVGDTTGATLEFLGHLPTPAEVARAMRVVGGGVWGVAPGQITDDGELTVALARALAEVDPRGPRALALARAAAAANYRRWYQSRPFDIGHTTSNALGLAGASPTEPDLIAQAMTQASARLNGGSKANGSLMRATPLGIWGHRLPTDALVELARADSALTHPNPSCCDAVACYALAIAHLVCAPGDRAGAVQAAHQWAEGHAHPEVQGWLRDAAEGVRVPGHPQAGFVKIAFTHAFAHLGAGTDFDTALEETLALGGDTDTNACIVAGLVGAAVGIEGVPPSSIAAVLGVDLSVGRPRPEWLIPRDAYPLVQALIGSGA